MLSDSSWPPVKSSFSRSLVSQPRSFFDERFTGILVLGCNHCRNHKYYLRLLYSRAAASLDTTIAERVPPRDRQNIYRARPAQSGDRPVWLQRVGWQLSAWTH